MLGAKDDEARKLVGVWTHSNSVNATTATIGIAIADVDDDDETV